MGECGEATHKGTDMIIYNCIFPSCNQQATMMMLEGAEEIKKPMCDSCYDAYSYGQLTKDKNIMMDECNVEEYEN